ncbi:hydroxymethylglutaryl-CoA lyase [Pseudomonadota bacterium]
MNNRDPVSIVEVAPRDGFQAVKPHIPTSSKIDIIGALIDANLRRLEVGAFVSPKVIPQMADTAEVHLALAKREDLANIRLSTLVPNAIGAKNALAAGLTDLVFVLSASPAHNQSNVRRSVAESLVELGKVIELGREIEEFRLRVNIATVFDCPFAGRVPEPAVLEIISRTLEKKFPVEFGLCDTTGRALPDQVGSLCAHVVDIFAQHRDIGWAFHGHDTYGLGVANALYAYDAGVRIFDASTAGLGGCPFAPGASGNTASEDLVFTFENMGVSTGVNLNKLIDATIMIVALPGVDTGGHIRLLPRERICNLENDVNLKQL